mgnify:CR=1 FL=1
MLHIIFANELLSKLFFLFFIKILKMGDYDKTGFF